MNNLFTMLGINDIGSLFIIWCILGVISALSIVIIQATGGGGNAIGCAAWFIGMPVTVVWLLVALQIVYLLLNSIRDMIGAL